MLNKCLTNQTELIPTPYQVKFDLLNFFSGFLKLMDSYSDTMQYYVLEKVTPKMFNFRIYTLILKTQLIQGWDYRSRDETRLVMCW